MSERRYARVGDVIAVNVREPHPRTIRIELATPEATAYANELLADPLSGWRVESVDVPAPAPPGASHD